MPHFCALAVGQGPAEYFERTYESTAGSHISLSTTSWLVSFLSILHDLCHTAQGPDWCSNPSDSLVYNLRGLCIFMEENEELKTASSDTLERFDDAAVTRAGLEEFARAFKYRQGALPWLPSDGARVESILSGGHSDALAERAAEAEMAKVGRKGRAHRRERATWLRLAFQRALPLWNVRL